MTLTEFPKDLVGAEGSDPQAVAQDIGGRSVTVIKIGKGCVTYNCVQGELALMLTNPYDPPAEPGNVKYSCEEMEKVIASIQ